MKAITGSIVGMLNLPIPIALFVVVVGAWIILPRVVENNAEQSAVEAASAIVEQFKSIRGYYTANIISKVKADGNLKPSFDHKKMKKGIPLPATFIHDISEVLSKKETKVKLYSSYPFPNRSERVLDSYQKEAWKYLNKNPKGTYVQRQNVGGKEIIRVAKADFMSKQGCVNCHNSRSDTPKDDWKLGDVRGVLEVSSSLNNALARGSSLSMYIMVAIVLVGLILTAINIFMARRVVQPINHMTGAMKRLAEGDTDIDVSSQENAVEISAMAEAVDVFRENAITRVKLEADTKAQNESREARVGKMEKLANGFDAHVSTMLESVSNEVSKINDMAGQLSGSAGETNSQSGAASEASDQAASNVQTVAAAAEQLSSSITEISRQVSQSAESTTMAVTEAERGKEMVQSLVEAAQKIGEVFALITDIADQTNLLALNATIEAARAGDAGKGFAVVASEVKNLANQTAKATEEISSQISDIQDATQGAVSAIDEIAKTIGEVNEISATISAAVEEQGAATSEIARSVENAANETQNVKNNIEGVSRVVSETNTVADDLLSAASMLSDQSSGLRQEVDKFLGDMRSV